MKRLDEEGPDALVQLPVPVNKVPDFVLYVVQRLKVSCSKAVNRQLIEDA
jgi:hypothetical protein